MFSIFSNKRYPNKPLLGAYASGPLLAYKIMRAGYYWLTMESDCIKHVGYVIVTKSIQIGRMLLLNLCTL